HVSPAFREDPVLILRLARFQARFPDFGVAAETLALCRRMVADGEVDHLVPERVWQELSAALMESQSSKCFERLHYTGAVAVILRELARLFGVSQVDERPPEIVAGVHTLMVIDQAARLGGDLTARFAALMHDLGKGL